MRCCDTHSIWLVTLSPSGWVTLTPSGWIHSLHLVGLYSLHLVGLYSLYLLGLNSLHLAGQLDMPDFQFQAAATAVVALEDIAALFSHDGKLQHAARGFLKEALQSATAGVASSG